MLARLIIPVLLIASAARAGTTIDVQSGFGGRERLGYWNPIFVTLSNDQPISVVVNVTVINGIILHRPVSIGPQSATYAFYAPLQNYEDTVSVDVTDGTTHKTIASWPNESTRPAESDQNTSADFFVLTAGRAPALRGFNRSIDSAVTAVETVRQPFLPTAPIGYDGVDLLFLNDPDWAGLSSEQQRAIIAWVDNGGVLMLWPGSDAIPANAPLADVLPAGIGATVTLSLDDKTRKAVGLPNRFSTIAERTLTPHDHVAMVPLIGDVAAPVAQHGLGRIIVLPIDAAGLVFKTPDQTQAFWNNFFDPIFGRPTPSGNELARYASGQSTSVAQQALDRIGTLPTVGTFSFYWVLLVTGGMMLLVGPVDYFLLKKLRRQPWTWGTTALWITLITTGALYAGQFVHSGALYFRTLQIIDQADGRLVGHDEVALVYAPRSAQYQLAPITPAWWQTIAENRRMSAPALTTSLDFVQETQGTSPLPMWIDIWNWQFLTARSYASLPAVVEASLRVDGKRIVGSVHNVSASPLSEMRIEVGDQSVSVPGTLSPGATQSIDTELTSKAPSFDELFALSTARNDAFHRPALAGFQKTAVLYASMSNASTDLALENPDARTEHSAVLRATVELKP